MIHISSSNLRTESKVGEKKKKKASLFEFQAAKRRAIPDLQSTILGHPEVIVTKFIRVSRPSPYLPPQIFPV